MEGFRWQYCVLFLTDKRVWRRFSQHINRPAQIVWSEMSVQLRCLLHRMPQDFGYQEKVNTCQGHERSCRVAQRVRRNTRDPSAFASHSETRSNIRYLRIAVGDDIITWPYQLIRFKRHFLRLNLALA